MSVILSILAAGSLPALIFGAPVPSLPSRDVAVADLQSLQKRSSSSYNTIFGGDGTTTDGWPSMDSWVSTYDEMFEANKATMSAGCSSYGFENDSDDEINDINNAIQSVSASSGVDARFILAIVMQESTGCVRVGATNGGVNNPGLMQSHNGDGTCNSGTPVSPCPSNEITQMIEDGTTGTADGDGLKQLLVQAASEYGVSGATMYYMAARMYNSGSVATDGNLGQGGATACYASDIANRLLGWSTGTSACNAIQVETLTTSESVSGEDGSASTTTTAAPVASTTTPAISVTVTLDPATTTAPSATPTETTPVVPPATTTTTTPPASATSAAASTTSSDSTTLLGPVYPGAVSTCQQWILVTSGDYCLEVEEDVGITASQFMDWNSGLDAVCSDLWLGYEYCIKA